MNGVELSDAAGRRQLRRDREGSGHRQDNDHLRRRRGDVGDSSARPGSATSSNDANQQGASTLTLKFRTTIDTAYSANPFPGSGTPILSLGDSVGNTVVANGSASASRSPTLPATTVTIVNATFTKSIYAFNGVAPPPVGFLIGPGDTVTYRITATIPLASFENARNHRLLAVCLSSSSVAFVPAGDTAIAFSGTPPAANHWTTGPLDNFTTLGTRSTNVSP